jgi:hypothetical protein
MGEGLLIEAYGFRLGSALGSGRVFCGGMISTQFNQYLGIS